MLDAFIWWSVAFVLLAVDLMMVAFIALLFWLMHMRVREWKRSPKSSA